MSNPVFEQIKAFIESKPVVIYMKGSPDFPQCGFSANAVAILKQAGVKESDLGSVNVLEDPSIRQAIKEYSNWPTIPQVYIKGKFVGGSDILMDLYESGELKQLLN